MSECIQMFPTYTLSTNKSNRQVILFLEVNIKTSFLCPKECGSHCLDTILSFTQNEEGILTTFYKLVKHFQHKLQNFIDIKLMTGNKNMSPCLIVSLYLYCNVISIYPDYKNLI